MVVNMTIAIAKMLKDIIFIVGDLLKGLLLTFGRKIRFGVNSSANLKKRSVSFTTRSIASAKL